MAKRTSQSAKTLQQLQNPHFGYLRNNSLFMCSLGSMLRVNSSVPDMSACVASGSTLTLDPLCNQLRSERTTIQGTDAPLSGHSTQCTKLGPRPGTWLLGPNASGAPELGKGRDTAVPEQFTNLNLSFVLSMASANGKPWCWWIETWLRHRHRALRTTA